MFTVSTPGFLSFGTFERGFFEEAWFWGVRVGFGGREGALASALIYRYIGMSISIYIVAYIAARIYRGWHESQECAIFKLR